MMKRSLFTLTIFALGLGAFQAPTVFASSGGKCAAVFAENEVQNPIDRMIHNLAEMRMNLDIAKAEGADTVVMTALIADFSRKENELVRIVDSENIMSREELLERIQTEISDLQNVNSSERKQAERERREENRRRNEQERKFKDLIIDGTRAVFHRIAAGPFKMGLLGNQVDVTITKDFEMMATKTTQIIWKKILLLAKKHSIQNSINPNPTSERGPTLPVKEVKYDVVQEWIHVLNELSRVGEPALVKLIPGHKQGDVYRLPTEAEWEFVMRGRGQFNDDYHFGNDASLLTDYAWFFENSGRKVHPVAQKKPLLIGESEFYDMHGNLYEWVSGWYAKKLSGGKDPQGPRTGDERIRRGGDVFVSAANLRSGLRVPAMRNYYGGLTGFRLVREVRD